MYNDYYDNDNWYYIEDFQWKLDVPHWEVPEYVKRLLHVVNMMQEERLSLRGTSRETGVSKSRIHQFIHTELGYYCSELKQRCINQMKWNKQNNNSFVRYRPRK